MVVTERNSIKGSHFIVLAKTYFILGGYVIYFGLAHLLGPEGFGIYGVVVGVVSVLNMIFVTGTIQGVSKFVSEDESRAEAVKRSSLWIQLILGGGTALVYFLLSPQIAQWFKDPALTPYLKLSSAIIVSYAFYAVFIGVLNGQKKFKTQALFDMTYSTLKASLTIGMVLAGWSVYGAIGGFVAASFLVFVLAAWKFGFHLKGEQFPKLPILRFALTVMGFSGLMTLIQQMDLFMLKALSPQADSNLLSGFYTSSLTLARIPYMIFMSLGLIVFPLVSRSAYDQNAQETASLIRQGIRICLLLVVPIVCLFSASPAATIDFIYPASFRPAGEALRIISWGYFGLTLFMITTTMISSTGHPHISFGLGVLTLTVQCLMGWVLIPRHPLTGAAWSTVMAAAIGMATSVVWLKRRFHALVAPLSFLRIFSAGLLVFCIAAGIGVEGLGLLIKDGLLMILYFSVLFLTRELTLPELQILTAKLAGGKKTESCEL